MQAESSLRALLRTNIQLRSICSTSLAAATRGPAQYRPSDRRDNESTRPDFTRRAQDGGRDDTRRTFRARREDGGRFRGIIKEGESYKGDFDSRLERSIERISSRTRERERPESSADARRGGYRDRDQQSQRRPGYQGGGGGGGRGGSRNSTRTQGYGSREPVDRVDRSGHIPGKASFGIRKPSPPDDPSTSIRERGSPAAASRTDPHEFASKFKFPRRDRDGARDRRPEDAHQTATSSLTNDTTPHHSRDGPRSAHPSIHAQPPSEPESQPQSQFQMPWRPAKKLTYQAMAGLRALHANDPKTFDKDALSQRFGISYEAVARILRSKYQDNKSGDVGESIQGTKWDLDARSSVDSPVPAVQRAFARRRSMGVSEKTGSDGGSEQS